MMTNDDQNESDEVTTQNNNIRQETKDDKLFTCVCCDYTTSRKSNLDRHNKSPKHKYNKFSLGCSMPVESNFKILNKSNLKLACVCGKEFTYKQGLSTHKKKCTSHCTINNIKHCLLDKNIFLEILSQNDEFKELIVQQNKIMIEQTNTLIEISKGVSSVNTTNNNNTVNNNSHNKTFNLQFFLNDTCKNAMNLGDFVSSLQIDLTDLESVGELGFVNGISRLIINGLNDLEECERPVHCSDLKRESMYVKDDNKWEKEDAENTKMKKALKQIAHKNIKMLPIWKAKNPDCKRSESHLSDKYSHMVIEAMGGSGDNDDEKANKIIRKIAKEVTIKKPV